MELTITPWSSALLHNDLGQHEEAFAATEQATEDPEELLLSTWALPERVEAAARTGHGDSAADALRRLSATTRAKRLGLGAGDRAALVRAADRGRRRRLALPRGDRKARPNAPSRAARPARVSFTANGCVTTVGAPRRAISCARRTMLTAMGVETFATARGRGSSRVARSSAAAAPRATTCTRSSRCSTSARASQVERVM